MKAQYIQFYLPKSALNKEVDNEEGRDNLLDFKVEDIEGVGLSLFDEWLHKMGGAIYTRWGMNRTPEDGELERMFGFIRHQLEQIPESYEDDDDDVDTAMRYLDQIEDLIRNGKLKENE